MSSLPNNIEHLVKTAPKEQMLAMLDGYIAEHPDDAEAWYLRGKVWWKAGERSKATSDYNVSAMLDPNGKGAGALEMARDIADFFNPDLLNP